MCMTLKDTRLARQALDGLKQKIASKKEIWAHLKRTINSKYTLTLFRSLYESKKILYVWKQYYYIRDAEEVEKDFNKMAPSEMLYKILNKLSIDWYLGLESALEQNKIVWQAINRSIVINSKFSGTFVILKQVFQFKKMRKNLFFGVQELRNSQGTIWKHSDIEKTIIDFVYYKKKVPADLLAQKNKTKLDKYLLKVPRFLRKKVELNG